MTENRRGRVEEAFCSKVSLLVKKQDEGKRRREREWPLDEVVGYNRL